MTGVGWVLRGCRAEARPTGGVWDRPGVRYKRHAAYQGGDDLGRCACRRPGEPRSAASRGAASPLAGGGSGSAFTAFGDPGIPIPHSVAGLENTVTGPSAGAPSAEQMAALADVMLFFPNGNGAANVPSAAAFARSAPSSAERIDDQTNGHDEPHEPTSAAIQAPVPTVREAKDGKEGGARAPDSRGPSSSGGGGSGDDDGGSGSDRGGGGSGDRGGSGSGSGEGGSGQSAQTKASNGRGTDGRSGRVSRGFESSSQREPSPPQPRR